MSFCPSDCIAAASGAAGGAGRWTSDTLIAASPGEVLEALTDPELIARWAPIDFEVRGLEGDRLRPGTHASVSGRVAGVVAAFEVEVLCADEHGVELVAEGPLGLDVSYRICGRGKGVLVQASISLRRRRGLTAQLLQAATAALLSSGVLSATLARLARVVEREPALSVA